MNHHFDNWHELMFRHAKPMITYRGILVFNQHDVLSESPDAGTIRHSFFANIVDAHSYWLTFGAGVEILVKAVATKHEVLTIWRNNSFDGKLPPEQTHFNNYDEVEAYRAARVFDKYQRVYQTVYRTKAVANHNQWLGTALSSANIEHPYQITTHTLRALVTTDIIKLIAKGTITQAEYDEILASIDVFRLIRRNVNVHSFLQSMVIGSINDDIAHVYIPLINLICAIYHR